AAFTAGIAAPVWRPELRHALLAVPRTTVTCEAADGLLAALLEGEIAAGDETRLRSHLARCAGCTESAAALSGMRSLAAPAPPPWLATRLAAAKPAARQKSFWRKALSGRMVVTYAYAAAVLVMLLGLNPTAVVRKAGFASLGESTRNAVTVAESSIGDRLGAMQERALRTLAVWRGHIGGYGRAAVSNALGFVFRPEPKKAPARPNLGKEGGAVAAPGDVMLAGGASAEPFRSLFRV
ncbi:MAG TPA: zf-HC2 domain-containing protein, partial [Thermoanaerobaculia bacterium]|nr:zf-HC2 domain-containing protein [Thermoanaerobaculia bacterium]